MTRCFCHCGMLWITASWPASTTIGRRSSSVSSVSLAPHSHLQVLLPLLDSQLTLVADCIRTYTWDKKLESWIKDRGKNKPTITSPKDYRMRFRFAMSTYILQAPNCWHQFQTQSIQKRPLAVRTKTGREEQEPEETEGQVVTGPAL